jgi:hypothetical protein
MKKPELLEQHNRKRAIGLERLNAELCVIEALPDDLDVSRIASVWTKTTDVSGRIELERAIKDIPKLMEQLQPVPMSRVVMERGQGRRTTAFYPTLSIPARWYEDDDRDVQDAIYPALVQIRALVERAGPAEVEVEWFIEPKEGFVVHVRARLTDHQIRFEQKSIGALLVADENNKIAGAALAQTHSFGRKWVCCNAPRGEVRRTVLTEGLPPYITVWWWETEIGDSLLEVLDGPGRDI